MRIAITQPNFLPWLGYFDLLDQVDLWVSLDNVLLSNSGRSFVTRNRIKLADGSTRWLGARTEKLAGRATPATAPLAAGDWPARHAAAVERAYRDAPFFDEYRAWIADLLRPRDDERVLAAYNERIIRNMAEAIGVSYDMRRASALVDELSGSPQDKIFALLDRVDAEADAFYNFERGVEQGLYDPAAFARRGVTLFKHAYRHPEYRQLGDEFASHLSAVDLLMNEGPRALEIIRSGSHWVDSTRE